MYKSLPILILLLVLAALVGCEKDNATSTSGDSDSDTDTDTDTDADADTDSDADTDGDADSDSDSDSDGDADSDGDSDSDSDSDSDTKCADLPWTVETKPINLLVLLDRSKSMKKFTVEGTDITYAEMVENAINAIVEQHTNAGIINFALNVFPSPQTCTAEYHVDDVVLDSEILCEAASQFTEASGTYHDPLVPFAASITPDTIASIAQVLKDVGNCGGTPISKSLEWAKVYLDSLSLENDTYVLLATDGAPGCNFELDISTCESASVGYEPRAPEMCLDSYESARAVYDLASAGYKTFVLGVGKDVEAFKDVTNNIAYWGVNVPDAEPEDFTDIPDPPDGQNWYYPAGDAETVNAALEDVINETISCEFEVVWGDVPDFDEVVKQNVVKSCTQTRVFGAIPDSEDKLEITYMESCENEDPESDNENMQIGWTWKELEGTSWEDLEALNTDTSGCTTIKLCENACNKLKTKKGIKVWSGVSASFGCKPIIEVE